MSARLSEPVIRGLPGTLADMHTNGRASGWPARSHRCEGSRLVDAVKLAVHAVFGNFLGLGQWPWRPKGCAMIRRYRVPVTQLVPWLICSAVFVLIGLGVATQPLHAAGVGGVIVGILVAAFGCVGAALRLTTYVALMPTEISYRLNFRRKTIPWASVESLRIGHAPGLGSWSCIVVNMKHGGGLRLPVVGSRHYVERVLGEFEAYRAELREQPLTTT